MTDDLTALVRLLDEAAINLLIAHFADPPTDPMTTASIRCQRKRRHFEPSARAQRICSISMPLTLTLRHSLSAVTAGSPSCSARAMHDSSPSPRPNCLVST